jgi:hypothetical protein
VFTRSVRSLSFCCRISLSSNGVDFILVIKVQDKSLLFLTEWRFVASLVRGEDLFCSCWPKSLGLLLALAWESLFTPGVSLRDLFVGLWRYPRALVYLPLALAWRSCLFASGVSLEDLGDRCLPLALSWRTCELALCSAV